MNKDPHLWNIARRRASFKRHLTVYIVVNLFLWAIWYFSTNDMSFRVDKLPWPVWSTLGWGLGLVFHYLGAYLIPKENSVEKEYEKLIKEKK